MELIALKSSFTREVEMNPQSVNNIEDYLCVNISTCGDEFSIEEFFDIPNEENDEIFEEEEYDDEHEKYTCYEHEKDQVEESTGFSTDLAIPVDDMQELELWSHLMDDTIQQPTLACPNPISPGFNHSNRVDPVYNPGFLIPFAVPVKPRTKRSRPTVNRSWVLGSSPKTESSSSSSSPVSTLFFPPPVHELGMLFGYGKQTVKKPKRKPWVGENQLVQRKCSHCQVTKTPQWRAGPYGPKTLCNACGVRFKSGRLFPEYRPACSPTFSSEIHSNSHRKVLEMRRKKEENESMNGSLSTVLSS